MLINEAANSNAKMSNICIHIIGFMKYFKRVRRMKESPNAMNRDPKITGQLFLKSLEYLVVSLIPM
jgi:hypothetical protein